MRRALGLIILAVGLATLAAPAGEPDPVRAKVTKARAAYEAEWGKFYAVALKHIDQAEDKARRAENSGLLERAAASRDDLKQLIAIPDFIPPAERRKVDAARKAVEAAYAAAIKDYERLKMPEKAAEAELELEVFQVASPFGGKLRLVNRHSGKVAAVADAATAQGAALVQADPGRGKDQHWRLVPDRDWFLLRGEPSRSVFTSGVEGAVVTIWARDPNDATHQQWKPEPVPGEKGYFRLRNRKYKLYLGVDGGSKDAAAKLVARKLAGEAGSPDLHWRFERVTK